MHSAYPNDGTAAPSGTREEDAPFWLDVQSVYFEQQLIPLAPGDLLIGQRADCDVSIPDIHLSRLHCLLSLSPRGLRLIDLDSTNGTWVNGRRVSDVWLRPSDLIKAGRTHMMLVRGHSRPDLERISRWHRHPHSGPNRPTAVLRFADTAVPDARPTFSPHLKRLAHQLV